LNGRIIYIEMHPLNQLLYSVSDSASGAFLFTYTVKNVAWGVLKHLATGYLIYSVIERIRGCRLAGGPVIAALIGSLGPDLIDKPLTWVGVLGYGRSFSHSLFTTIAILIISFVLACRFDSFELSFAFAVGYLSHILVDMFGEIFGGLPYVDTAFLFWPVVVKQPTGVASPALPVSDATVFILIMASAAVLWVLDGMVGVSDAVEFARKCLHHR
jgi:membrane-bound metal-dependent hydrolase YbcI (DUF457 family)